MSTPTPSPALSRWYIDTRPLLTTSSLSLPLLSTLQPPDQTTVQKYYFLRDRYMSLASYLLKYFYIHKTCHVPWNEIVISRTAKPHSRPCYIPTNNSNGEEVEFNISHQASLVVLAGCAIPANSAKSNPKIGIDITCTDEPNRRQQQITTEAEFAEFVDIHTEVFSEAELSAMKSDGDLTSMTSGASLEERLRAKIRRFYAYWALKEAYIKMTGEALLARWIREVEFRNVHPPPPECARNKWGQPEKGVQIWFMGEEIRDVRMELVAYEANYLIATAVEGEEGKGVGGAEEWDGFREVDLMRDIGPCARGECGCLD